MLNLEVEISQCVPPLWVVLVCLLDNSTNNDLAAWRSRVYRSETKQHGEACKCVCVMCDATTMCVISLDRFVCVAWMPELSINAAKL